MSTNSSQGMSGLTKFYLTIVVILILALVGLYLWKEVAVRGAALRYEAERAEIVERTRTALVDQTREMLRLSAVPLGWSVRTEMIKENYHQIDDYLQRFVKEPHVSRIALVNYEGSIQIATDKKLEGQRADSVFPRSILEVGKVTVHDEGTDEVLVAVPILSYDARLGTLVLAYSLSSVSDKLPAPAPEDEPAAAESTAE
jgi:hypothetical protein